MHPGQGSPASHEVGVHHGVGVKHLLAAEACQRVNVGLMAGPCAYDTRFVANHTADDSEGGGCTCAGESHDSSQAGTQLQVHRGGQGRSRGGRAKACAHVAPRRVGVLPASGWAPCHRGHVAVDRLDTLQVLRRCQHHIGTPHDRAIQFAIHQTLARHLASGPTSPQLHRGRHERRAG